jgi:amidophosphoribosyltransferase
VVDSPHEACGIFGIFAPGEDVARLTFFGLYALQHRGQESAGIATGDGQSISVHTAMGLVSQVFDESVLAGLRGTHAVGHTRYSTTGSTRIENAQPVVATGASGEFALAHNGNVINAQPLRRELEGQGYRFNGSTDSEVIAALLATAPGGDLQERIRFTMGRLHGAYCLALLTKDAVIGIRDPLGVRPLCLGQLNGGDRKSVV